MRVSVALATYNGARFLRAQLESLAAQTRRPDEVVICDDGSTDETVAMARAFAAEVPVAVRVEAHGRRLGATGNFERAVRACTGDVIALCDQDDRWHEAKLARLAAVFEREPGVGLAFSDARLVDDRLEPLGERLWPSVGFTAAEQRLAVSGRLFEVLLRHNVVTGATLAFRASHRALVLPFSSACIQDEWVALLISAVAPCRPIDETLVDYRQHGGQQIGGRRRSWRSHYRRLRGLGRSWYEREWEKYREAWARLRHWPGAPASAVAALEARWRFAERRLALPANGAARATAVIRHGARGEYRRFGLGWRSAMQDLLCGGTS